MTTFTITVATSENRKAWTLLAPDRNEAWRAAWGYATTQIKVGREITDITVEAEPAGSATEPVQLSGGWYHVGGGWQLRKGKEPGTTEYRRSVEVHRPALRQYARIWVHADGQVYGQSEQGYMRRFDTVQEAQERLGR